MRGLGYLLVLIVVCMGIAVASAVPDSISVSSSEPWLIAISGQSSTITAHVFNQASPGELYQGEVRFSLETPSMGILSQLIVTTDASGYASTEFTASTVRGNAIIRADVTEYPSLYNTTLVPVYGPKPDETSTMSTSSEWIVASGLDHSTITFTARNQSVPISGLKVTFRANDTSLGKFNPLVAYTNASGMASTTFLAMQKSGTAKISGTVEYNIWDSPASVVFNVDQKIDHDTPYRIANYTVTSDVGVGNATVISALIVDRWNNPVDNKRVPENFSFLVSSPTPPAKSSPPNSVPAYWTSTPYSNITIVQTDIDGNVGAGLTVDTRPGMNVVLLHPIGIPVHDKYFFINGVANGQPWYLEQAFEPPELWVFADGEKLFNITYTLRDRYGNGLPNRNITWWTNLPNETATISTNISGMARRSYGPKSSVGFITITAQAEDNLELIVQETVEFSNMDPVSMRLTASPQSMPSRDVAPDDSAQIIAKVMDIKGNPVDNEIVTFTINHPGSYPVSQVRTPSFNDATSSDTISAITDQNGDAIVRFWPGTFESNDLLDLPDYDPQATASCDVSATWGSISDTVSLTWKNYPYLSVYTNVFPKVVNVSDTVDVNIKLVGDGYALKPKPIDVLLLLDNSGSMGLTSDTNSAISQSKRAAVTFIDQMEQDKDRVGVIFYDKGFPVYLAPTYNLSAVKTAINSYTRSATKGYHTRTRNALYHAITLMNETTRDRQSVRAIIHMTDGLWSMEGDPLARGTGFNLPFNDTNETIWDGLHKVWAGNMASGDTPVLDKFRYFDDLGGGDMYYGNPGGVPNGQPYDDGTRGWAKTPPNTVDQYETTQNITNTKQVFYFQNAGSSKQNMSVYANQTKLRMYSIGFTATANKSELIYVLRTMAEANKGFYSYAPSEASLKTLYTQIAGALKEEAGVNTIMDLNYENVEVNSTPMPGNQVFDYVPIGPLKSTKVDSYLFNITPNPRFPGYPFNFSQLNNWTEANNYVLHFNVGTIHLNQTWEANYTLRVLKDGNINLFSLPSLITFNNGTNTITLPKTYISAIPNMMNESIQNITLDEGNVTHDTTNSTNYTYQWNWTRTYTGSRDVTEKYFVSIDGGQQWVQVGERIMPAAVASAETLGTFRVDLRTVPGGEDAINAHIAIRFRLEAYASDAGEPEIAYSQAPANPAGTKPHIKLE